MVLSARFRGRRVAGLAAATVLASSLTLAAPAGAATSGWGAANHRVDLKVLVVDDGGAAVGAIRKALAREGVPFVAVNLNDPNRRVLGGTFLSENRSEGPWSKFQAVVLPDEAPAGLEQAELDALHALERRFGVRQVTAYTWANPRVGLRYADNPGYVGTLDGMTATATTAGKASGFGYLRGSLRIDDFDPAVSESYGYLALPLPADTTTGRSFEPLVTTSIPATGEQAPILGVYRDNGREELVSTFVYNGDQEHFLTLAHGMVTWLTRGIHLGHYRQYFSVHIDDVLLPNDRWSTEADCTAGADCNPNRDPAVAPYNEPIRMTGADAAYLESWQRARGFKLDLAYNAQGSAEAIAEKGRDELTDALLARKAEFRWINHTYGHEYLGCVKDYSVRPWRCTTDPVSGAIVYVGKAKIKNEITRNVSWATTRGIPVDKAELVTGEHSGLRALPQMQQDNPNFGPALTETGVTTTASDASREPLPRAVGAARTLPRYPMNIFYNVGTAAEEVDEYNWIYTSRANGGSGLCEDNPATSTCIEPLDPATAFRSHIVPLETRIAMRHVLSVDPRPHYAHQSNLAEERILYPVVDEVLAEQRATFAANTPVVNPRMREAAVALDNQQAWAANKTKVTAYVSNGVVSVVNNTGAQLVPITLPNGSLSAAGSAFGSAYAGERSSWVKIWQSSTETFRLPAGA